MIKILMSLSLCFFVSSAFGKTYGEEFAMPKGGGVPVDVAIKSLAKADQKEMRLVAVQGEISSVCQSKGCWVTLKTGDSKAANSCEEALKGMGAQKELRVMFKGHSFEVPKKLKGSVVVYGDLEKKKLSKFQLKHLLKDAGCPKAAIKKVKGSLYKYQMTATGVRTI